MVMSVILVKEQKVIVLEMEYIMISLLINSIPVKRKEDM